MLFSEKSDILAISYHHFASVQVLMNGISPCGGELKRGRGKYTSDHWSEAPWTTQYISISKARMSNLKTIRLVSMKLITMGKKNVVKVEAGVEDSSQPNLFLVGAV